MVRSEPGTGATLRPLPPGSRGRLRPRGGRGASPAGPAPGASTCSCSPRTGAGLIERVVVDLARQKIAYRNYVPPIQEDGPMNKRLLALLAFAAAGLAAPLRRFGPTCNLSGEHLLSWPTDDSGVGDVLDPALGEHGHQRLRARDPQRVLQRPPRPEAGPRADVERRIRSGWLRLLPRLAEPGSRVSREQPDSRHPRLRRADASAAHRVRRRRLRGRLRPARHRLLRGRGGRKARGPADPDDAVRGRLVPVHDEVAVLPRRPHRAGLRLLGDRRFVRVPLAPPPRVLAPRLRHRRPGATTS